MNGALVAWMRRDRAAGAKNAARQSGHETHRLVFDFISRT